VGGLEAVRELHDQGQLKKLLEYRPAKKLSSIGDRFKNRFKSSKGGFGVHDIPPADMFNSP
jgi:hypothetical protein